MSDTPKKLGKYEIRRELGRGAMGIVYEGWDPMIARRVALKTVRKEQLERTEAEEILSRFQREAQAAGRLNHPNVVAVYDFGETDDGTAFIAMEFVEGRELKDYFDKQERFPLSEIVRLMGELLGALGHAHHHGIVHRDIKPANIFVLSSGQAKVGDFGIARIESSNLTQAGSVLGTPAYMSPEQFMGQTVDGRSDLFSAGVILYQFLTGEKPFAGQLTTIMHKVLKEDPIAPSELNVQVSPVFDGVIKKAMAKRPEERFQKAADFFAAIEAAAAGKSIAADSDATYVGGAADGDATLAHHGAEVTQAYQGAGVTMVHGGKAPSAGQAPAAARPAAAPPPPPPSSPSRGASFAADRSPAAQSRPAANEPKRGLPGWALAAGISAVVLAGGGVALMSSKSSSPAAPPVASTTSPAMPTTVTAAKGEESPRTMTISAVAIADPADPRLAADPNLLRTSLREEAKRELVEKAVALYVQSNSLSQNYSVLRDKFFNRSGDFIEAVLQEGTPQTGKDGLVTMDAKATVRIRDVQKSLNQMSKDERVDFIRNNGDPRIAVAISTTGTADGAATQRSPIAENSLKEKIQGFGFRTWNEEGGEKKPDFSVVGEVKFKKLSVKLEASGLVLERTAITSWTIKCVDRKSGEEIYFNTTIPQKAVWNSEDEALADIGRLIGEEFSKNFFLQHFEFAGQKVKVVMNGLPDDSFSKRLLSELSGLRNVLGVSASKTGSEARYEVNLSGGMINASDLVAAGIVMPLNRKFGKNCFSVSGGTGNEVNIGFEPACKDQAIISRLDSAPPAALFEAPDAKRQAIVKNPEVLKRLSI